MLCNQGILKTSNIQVTVVSKAQSEIIIILISVYSPITSITFFKIR